MEYNIVRNTIEKGPLNIGTIDSLGRVRLHREALTALDWQPGLPLVMELLPDGSGAVLRRSRDLCAHCGETNKQSLVPVTPDSRICLRCLDAAQHRGRQ